MSETCKRCKEKIPMNEHHRCKCMDNNDHANECEYIANKILTDESLIFAAACVREKAIVIRKLTAENTLLRECIDKVPRQDLPEIRKWMIEVIENNLCNEQEL